MGEARVCVLCRERRVDARWRPFCGERCRNEDLARWVEGTYSIPAEPEFQSDSDEQGDESNR